MKDLLVDILNCQIWREKVYFLIRNKSLDHLKVYLTLLYESTLVNLMESIAFHRTSFEALDSCGIDLLEYVYGNLVELTHKGVQTEGFDKISYDISMSCLSIFRYATDHMKHLSLSLI